ncbi:MAG: M64 family metallopeptidase [Ignavibacteriaceae bacterium]
MDKFKNDCKKVSGYLFSTTPFKENKNKFNVWGIEAPSEQEGTDIPADHIWKKTLLNTSFYTLNLKRYLMTTDNKKVRNIASNAPYDQIYILVNTSDYGGGAIYNYYSVCVSDNPYSEYIFVHEFGHGFAYLADEYSEKNSPYINFYNFKVEPTEPNLTTLVDFKSKWEDLVKKSTPIPTPATSEYKNAVGAFEGGGYVEKGIYRPMEDCEMRSISINNFCVVCKRAIQEMIDFYSR